MKIPRIACCVVLVGASVTACPTPPPQLAGRSSARRTPERPDAAPEPGVAEASAEQAGVDTSADESRDDSVAGSIRVFRSWAELPAEERLRIRESLFKTRVVLRVNVIWGCTSVEPSKRPKKNYAWGSLREACIRGRGSVHPLHVVDADAKFIDALWQQAGDDTGALQPMLTISTDAEGTSVGFAPPVVPPGPACDLWLSDIHWLAVPMGQVRMSYTEGSNRCMTIDPRG